MSQNLTNSAFKVSDIGVKLIKAFEGYRPVDRELVTGQRIVGYGHRLYSNDAVMMSKVEAEDTLLADLEPFEDMINSEVHAPITQSQFDALCSFAFNIGPRAFLTSDTLRALNNGRPLDAANGLDVWRKSEIAGNVYVVDALMRRRTAEKALFLRTERELPAGREDLPPVRDTTIAGLLTEDALPVFTNHDANGIVATAPYDAAMMPMRRREDNPVGALLLSELDIIPSETDEPDDTISNEDVLQTLPDEGADVDTSDDVVVDEGIATQLRHSPIAAAATDILARLDALIEDADADADAEFEDDDSDWPESLITAELDEEEMSNISGLGDTGSEKLGAEVTPLNQKFSLSEDDAPDVKNPIVVIDELAQDDAFRVRTDSAAKYIQSSTPVREVVTHKSTDSVLGLWVPVILGSLLVGPASIIMIRDSEKLLGDWGPIIAFTGFVIGVGLILAGVYAALRMNSDN